MAVRKINARPTAEDRRIADRVQRARAAQPPRDVTGEHHATICELAKRLGRDACDLLDTWDERAAAREYDGNVSRADAERLAVQDVIEICDPQRKLTP